ncbi:hypothetical protein IFR04_012854 [Cadophora malorum]|uniref:4-coumarate:coenzyme A ligase n=1 Tax=Cadophora malorum TaxID=108018 RepID=A0A8H7T7N4_9HELO|nr:hypothetical protein IFR04_012854 [Cadophora malorum]
MPPLPAARTFTLSPGRLGGAAIGVSCAVGSVPLLCLIPGVEERLAAQAAVWGPRWSRGFAAVTPHVSRQAERVEPGIKKGVEKVEPPLKRAAFAVDRNIKKVVPERKE